MSAALIQRLIEAGTPTALVAEVAMLAGRAEAAAAEALAERKRSRDRDYRRRVRSADTPDMFDSSGCGDSDDSVDSGESVAPPPSPDKESGFPTPLPKEINPIPRARGARMRGGTRIPADFVPDLAGPTVDMVARWPPGRLEREIAQFRDHYARLPGSKGLSLDWQASLRTWLRNADDRIPHAIQDSSAGLGRTAAAAIAVFGRPADRR